jgi:hypothetical protein
MQLNCCSCGKKVSSIGWSQTLRRVCGATRTHFLAYKRYRCDACPGKGLLCCTQDVPAMKLHVSCSGISLRRAGGKGFEPANTRTFTAIQLLDQLHESVHQLFPFIVTRKGVVELKVYNDLSRHVTSVVM